MTTCPVIKKQSETHEETSSSKRNWFCSSDSEARGRKTGTMSKFEQAGQEAQFSFLGEDRLPDREQLKAYGAHLFWYLDGTLLFQAGIPKVGQPTKVVPREWKPRNLQLEALVEVKYKRLDEHGQPVLDGHVNPTFDISRRAVRWRGGMSGIRNALRLANERGFTNTIVTAAYVNFAEEIARLLNTNGKG
uniref:Uncharacterized protein n=1 Tax=Chromera velia CCMP2878 TaxID=1169474 RepID=A0A0G4H085_9ALVE|eukprot:Cvel_24153.t1-p1 / transcript=Cvel_24153.t1 / gene=Cvel_24153 / organism=Chromera_velia_CCMP2878 / gene_product=hypothetical protein / transcript_product=hypothetical protein / location=Cvel_scaffold2578:14989-15555(+) / protein_length=189 / sequence_SO=supercontig / SO=protein_coding / is_pseudo=false